MTFDLNDRKIDLLLDRLDGSGSDDEWTAVAELRVSLNSSLPVHLLRRFRLTKKWASRSSLVYQAIRFAQKSPAAIELGLVAVRDKSKVVRYRACMLLACSQCKELLPELLRVSNEVAADSREDVLAAVDAIEFQNQDYFVDRDHSGLITLNVN